MISDAPNESAGEATAGEHRITRWLRGASDRQFATYAIAAAFCTYFCMYAFRKPFAVGEFEGDILLGFVPPIAYKTLLVTSQVIGYCSSKFIGIKVVSELPPGRRAMALVGLILVAELALVLFGLIPAPYNALCMVLNGLPLGMVWGIVFAFLEGRRISEVLGAGLAASFIVASGAVKSVGRQMMVMGVPEHWMPAATGMLFLLPILGFIWMLRLLPPPSKEDERLRTRRAPMDGRARLAFFAMYAPGLTILTAMYVMLTALRDFRDNFARELWDALGYGDTPSIFATAEIPIAIVVLLLVARVWVIRDNRWALLVIHGLMLGGTLLVGLSTAAWQLGLIDGAVWMILVGLGLYAAYVPYNCILFDRLIAAVGFVGTAAFFIYVTDAFGYLGSVALMLYKDFGHAELPWIEFFAGFCYATSGTSLVLFTASALYFGRKTSSHQA